MKKVDNKQLEFENSFESLEEVTIETCDKCGNQTVVEGTVESCDEPTCEYDQLDDNYYKPCYSEMMFDEEGNYIKNFLGKEK